MACFSKDIGRFLNKGLEPIPDDFKHRASAFFTPELMALFLYRLAHYLHARGWFRLARLVTFLNYVIHKISIPPHACLGPGAHIPHPAGISFAGTAAANLTMYSLAVCGPAEADPDARLSDCPELGNHVTLGAHAVVMGPVRVGDNAKIAYSMRVTRDVPAGAIVVSSALRMRIGPRPPLRVAETA
jgi:serine O-acetyltransferase